MGVSTHRAALAALRTTTGRRIAGAVAAIAVTTTGVAAVAATEQSATAKPRIVVPPVAVQQAGGVKSLPALPALPALALPDPNSSIPPESLPGPSEPQTWGMSSVAGGIPAQALAAYQAAQQLLAQADPGCKIDWALLAGIGKVESDHGRWGRNLLDAAGNATPGIYGIPLNGNGVARITDTDGGRFDRDVVFDRAVGPMQFIPGTWKSVGQDGNGDGKRDPQNMADAATSAGVYLCSGPGDLTNANDLTKAVLRYNNSMDYVRKVTSIAASYRAGHSVLPATALPPGYADRSPYLPPAPSASPTPTSSASSKPTPSKTTRPTTAPKPGSTSKPTSAPEPEPEDTTAPPAPAPKPTVAPKLPVPVPKVTATPLPSTTVAVDPDPFSPGDTVKITAGEYLGLSAKVLKVDTAANTVTVEVNVLGLLKPSVVLPYSSVKLV
ncbi:membrane-bound lytic murein transglycosylase B [Knoellia remsis]|uniref:Membrane-bound lytic murein transglycosylase B n=1 Tax=Knoellia remsis TaxID=407159 RepID=A0A2T0U6D3_9MICO|nr:lytic murein transglycosylase [Knoellia remsis]PRY53471.1 membrane-bound lytic murein transglycosylase B [Knoellia remsis]